MSGQKRIAKELADVTRSPPEGMKVSLIDESDIHKWKIVMEGPPQSVYAGGIFHLLLTLPPDYPFKPPTLTFKTKIYHPNITNDDKGSMCLGMLRADEWKPSSKIAAVLDFAKQLLVEPMPDDAVEAGIAQLYKEDRKEWGKRARNYTKAHAWRP